MNSATVDVRTGKTVRLANIDTSNLSFPIAVVHAGQQYFVYAADVDKFFDDAYLPAGYTRQPGSTASMNMNCHGYATSKNCWLQDEGVAFLLQYDYSPSLTSESLENKDKAIYEAGAGLGSLHTVVAEVTTTINGNGEKQFTVVKTREKYNVSGIYEKHVDMTFPEATNAVFPLTYTIYNGNHVSGYPNWFWVSPD